MRRLMTATAVIVGTVAFACNGSTGGGIGTHDGSCEPVGSTQVRSDHTTWKCVKGDPGDYPHGTWERVS